MVYALVMMARRETVTPEAPLKRGNSKIMHDGVRIVGLFDKNGMPKFFPSG
ncbi:hypothetical protein SAMN02787144_1007318 [Streptomyces atratus]|uniref:Uncharacterized protein n=1 Tax=Streptomyces atratus TaxID=1893 RepID=A0A1K2AWA8_STRAR|nr:hypothetical protein SAMN02787144_1007318 [Streptomyces atratus]